MSMLIVGLLIFLGVHCVSIINDPWRNRMVEKVGEIVWKGGYSLLSGLGFILIIWGYGIARENSVELYIPPLWLQHFSMLLLVPVFPLLLSAYLPGRIKAAVKHPMLLSIKIWAAAHLLANGSAADLLLFGSFLLWAVWDRISLKKRQLRPVPGMPPAAVNDIIAVVLGLGLYLGFIFGLHEYLIGVGVY
jgi:uncharacterized membrane protein